MAAIIVTWNDALFTWNSGSVTWDGQTLPAIHPLKTNRYGGGHRGVKRFPTRDLDILRKMAEAGKGPVLGAEDES